MREKTQSNKDPDYLHLVTDPKNNCRKCNYQLVANKVCFVQLLLLLPFAKVMWKDLSQNGTNKGVDSGWKKRNLETDTHQRIFMCEISLIEHLNVRTFVQYQLKNEAVYYVLTPLEV